MKSARHNRLLTEAKSPNATMTVDQINTARSFGAKAFRKKKAARKVASASRKANHSK